MVMLLSATLLFSFIYLIASGLFLTKKKPSIQIEMKVSQIETMQIFYDIGNGFNLSNTTSKTIQPSGDFQIITLELPNDSLLKDLRIDFGTLPTNYFIKRISIVNQYAQHDMYSADIVQNFKADNDIEQFMLEGDLTHLTTNGEDPIMLSNFDIETLFKNLQNTRPSRRIPIIITLLVCIGIIILLNKRIRKVEISPSRQILLVGFLVILFSPLLFMYIGLNKSKDNNEFRTKAEVPKWDLMDWENYLKKYNVYFEDQFGFRSELIQFYANYKTRIWHSSPIPDKVLIGKNNWLYTVEDSLMEDYRGIRKFKQRQLEEIYTNIMYRKERLKKMGIEYLIVVAPNKQTIYPEYIPSEFSIVNKETRWKQTKTYLLNKGIDFIIDPADELLKQKNSYQSYYKTDLHWNNMGAFIASNLLLEQIQKKFPQVKMHDLKEYQIKESPFTKGDMARMISTKTIADIQYEFISEPLQKIMYTNGPAYPSYVSTQPVIITFTTDTAKPRVLMFRDSFGNGMVQFISQESSKAVYVWTHVFDWAIIEQEKPSIVIHEISEKLIHKFLEE